jgi:glycerol uptake facilitator-like aquaporin
MTAQLLGSILAGVTVLLVYGTALRRKEESLDEEFGVGGWGKERTGMVFGEYFPNPDSQLHDSDINAGHAFAVEALGTLILMMMILALTDDRNPARPPQGMAPFFIGFTVAVLISLLAPLTQAGFNPARDFGPRIVAALSGWGDTAIPGPRDGFWVYILGPLVGAPLGALLYDILIAPGLPQVEEVPEELKCTLVPGCWDPVSAELQSSIMKACTLACQVECAKPAGCGPQGCGPQPVTASLVEAELASPS